MTLGENKFLEKLMWLVCNRYDYRISDEAKKILWEG